MNQLSLFAPCPKPSHKGAWVYWNRNVCPKCEQKAQKHQDALSHRKLKHNIRRRLKEAVRNAKKYQGVRFSPRSQTIGCSAAEFKKYIESLWTEGMSWNNYGYEGWHIDHIKPLSSFDLTSLEEQTKANHYTNLQPLWAKDNYAKGGIWAI